MEVILSADQVRPAPGVLICRWRWETLAIILVLALQLIYFTGFISSDDGGYVHLAHCVREGQPVPKNLHYLGRFVHWGALFLVLQAWPWHIEAVVVVPLLATFTTLWIIRSFARRYLKPSLAPPALLIFGLIPVVVVNASVALPDATAMAFGWIGVYLAAGVFLQRDIHRALLRALAAGFLIGVSYNAKESTLIMVPGLLLFVFLFRTRCLWAWKRAAFLALGTGLWLTGEMAVMGWLYGDPFFHKHVIAISQRIGGPFAELTPIGLLSHWTDYLRWLLDPRTDYALIGPVLLAGLVYGFLAKQDALRLLLCVIMPSLLYLIFGSSELGHYVPLCHQTRYLLPLLPGMALLAADMLGWFWQRGPRMRKATVVAAAVIFLYSLWAPNRIAGKWYYADVYRAGYRLLKDHQNDLQNHRLYAAQLTVNRFFLIPRYLDIPEVEVIHPFPMTATEWKEHYGGTFILTSPVDHRPIGPPRHTRRILTGTPYAALQHFECVACYEPPCDRISLLGARILGRPVPTNPAQAVKLWYIPTNDEAKVTSGPLNP